ncbi:LPXTG cell wall anchor domain-containing protein, partial [Listeria ivanovii]|nr:LPXTG cell wall anchor domain-containing protein [Listeria ivanovii]
GGGTTPSGNSNHQHTTNYEATKPLPKTGNQTDPWLVWTGLGLLSFSLLLWLFNRRRRSFK